MPYKYENGKWTYVPGDDSPPSRPSDSGGNSPSPTPPQNKPSDNDNRETTETKEGTDQEYIEVETNILEGSCNIPPNPNIHAKATVKLTGIGKQLNGLYYVEKVTHNFSSSGYSQDITVTREGFGDSIKKGNVNKPGTTPVPSEGRPVPSPPPQPPKENPPYILINRWGVVTPSIGLNVRTGPSTSNTKIGAMTCGTRVFCIGKKGDWYDHKYGGQTAWSHGDYIRLE